MPTQRFEYRRILEILSAHSVDYILIGGVCAAAHGAPVATLDVGILYNTEPANVDRVMAALAELEAVHREPGNRRLPPSRSALEHGGPCHVATTYGSLDLLGLMADGRGFEELQAHTVALTLREGLPIRMLDLETLIDVKRSTGRATDLAVMPILEATLKARGRFHDK